MSARNRKVARHGIANNAVQLHAIMRALADKRNMSRRTIDELAGFTVAHTERMLTHIPQKRIGMDSLFPLVWALGARIVIEDDPAQLERIKEHLNGRDLSQVRACRASMKVKTLETLRKLAKEQVKIERAQLSRSGGKGRARSLSRKRRRAIARHAAITRHKRERAERAAARCAPGSTPPILKTAQVQKPVKAPDAVTIPHCRNDNSKAQISIPKT